MNDFVNYLNGLHNYYAQNQNAYGERNISSPFYHKTMVSIDICDYIISLIKQEEPHIIILTGHAGDGKTSIMYQVLESLGAEVANLLSDQEVILDNNKHIRCIKDFSELSDNTKLDTLNAVLQCPSQGRYVFMVSNTGPLINTFGRLFSDEDQREKAKMDLIERLDTNDGKLEDLFGHKMCILNMAAIDNTSFSRRFLDKVLNNELWESCNCCPKREYCHIRNNHDLIIENKERVYEFIEYYYIWQTEYGKRLTIRSMAEHLAYMITGGDDCNDVVPSPMHEKLFANLFFGYEGIISNPLAENIFAVKLAKDSRLYLRRIRTDEELLIRRNYKGLFGKTVNIIIDNIDNSIKRSKEFDDELRRMFFFMNILTGEQHKRDLNDIFSKQFLPYIDVRNYGKKPSKSQKNLVVDALRMVYHGSVISDNNMIPITMGSEDGITQSVKLIAGRLNVSDIELNEKKDSELNTTRKNIILKVKQKEICRLSLPLMDHFEELKNGVIATNMDPQLSHGIENLKSNLLELADIDEDKIDLLIMKNDGFSEVPMEIEDGIIILQ